MCNQNKLDIYIKNGVGVIDNEAPALERHTVVLKLLSEINVKYKEALELDGTLSDFFVLQCLSFMAKNKDTASTIALLHNISQEDINCVGPENTEPTKVLNDDISTVMDTELCFREIGLRYDMLFDENQHADPKEVETYLLHRKFIHGLIRMYAHIVYNHL